LERLAIVLDDRQTGNRHGLASQRLPSVPDLESPSQPVRPTHGPLKLGIDIGQTSVGEYMVRGTLSQTWRTFLDNHLN
jgi:hypothetical protein